MSSDRLDMTKPFNAILNVNRLNQRRIHEQDDEIVYVIRELLDSSTSKIN